MGLQSALTTSLTGLQAAETTISVVGNNVANANTVGFKASDTVFATQFLQTITIGSAPSTGSGGTNPQQIGLGVQVAAITPDFSQGTIEISANPLDIAIQGEGFLQVQGLQGETLFTRNGQLALNSLNELTTLSGQRVLGFAVNEDFELQTATQVPITIPVGAEQVAQATETATFSGTLNPAVAQGTQPSISTSEVLGDASVDFPVPTTGQEFNENDLFLPQTPAPGTAAVGAAGAGPGAGVVNYRVAFADSGSIAGFNESAFSAEFSVTATGANSIDLTGLPVPDGTQFDDLVLYRTLPDGNDFFRVGTIDDLGGTAGDTAITDNVDDASLGAPLEDGNVEAGVYSYFVTYFNPSTGAETRPAPQIGPVSVDGVAGNRIRVNLGDLAPPVDENFNQLRIYRQVGGTSEFRLLPTGIIDAPTATTPALDVVDRFSNAEIATEPLVNLDGPPASTSTLLTDLTVRQDPTSAVFETIFEEGTLTFNPAAAGVDLGSQQLQITSTTNVQDLIEFLQGALGIDTASDIVGSDFPTEDALGNPISPPGVRLTTDGQIEITSNLGEQNALEIPLTAFNLQPAGTSSTNTVGIQFSETQEAIGPGTSTELTVFDSLGLPINVRITTVLESQTGNSTTYRFFATSADNEPSGGNTTVVGDGILTFDANGDLLPGPATTIAVQRNDTASLSPLEIELDFSGVASLGQTNALGELTSTLNFTSQDGFPPGTLTDFIITDDGTIQGQFSNGVQQPLGQIVLARFANNQGLQALGDNLYTQSVNSGPPITDVPGENGLGTLSAGAVELSNTDIGQNLIELILASTQYRGGSRVITSTQELIDELLALV